MTLDDIKRKCEEQIARYAELGLTSKPEVQFMMRGRWPSSGTKRLFGRVGPVGRCVSELEDGLLCAFGAQEILDFIAEQEAPSHA